jgi:hypothetical protein
MRSFQLVTVCSFLALGACGLDPTLAIPGPQPSGGADIRIPDDGAVLPGHEGAPIEVAAIEFGVVDAQGSATATAVVTNVSDRSVVVGAMTTGGAAFTVVESDCGVAMAPGAACEVAVTFTPGAIGDVSGTLALVAGGIDVAVSMHGAGGGWIRVAKSGPGSGMVGSDVGDIACGDVCDALVATPILLSARPATGSTFAGWTGPCDAQGKASCVVTPTMAPVDMIAKFAR